MLDVTTVAGEHLNRRTYITLTVLTDKLPAYVASCRARSPSAPHGLQQNEQTAVPLQLCEPTTSIHIHGTILLVPLYLHPRWGRLHEAWSILFMLNMFTAALAIYGMLIKPKTKKTTLPL